ncbi:MAG: CDP-diacylglycerol diphosphatase [Methylovirgula sp.]
MSLLRQVHGLLPARIAVALLLAVAVLAAYHSLAISKDRNTLWKIAHDKCVPDEEENHNPAPCAFVDLDGGQAQGYVILKDRRGATQFLLIPTRRISGIESPDLLSPDARNYWAAAWENRRFVSSRAERDLAWDMIGLAVNSSSARSQDQLHIHIDCLHLDVRGLLSQHIAEIGTTWTKFPFDLVGRGYFARRLAATDLAVQDPFKLLAGGLPAAGRNMGQETLAVVGVSFAPGRNGFVLLAARADPAKGERAHGEDLLDHSCAVARAE